MSSAYIVTDGLQGMYCDVLRDGEGRTVWESGWRKNTIVIDCRRLLATFMNGAVSALGIQGMKVGAGLAAWDQPPGPPPPGPTQIDLVDKFSFPLKPADLKIEFLDPNTGTPSLTPTSRIQIVATLGPGMPNWPDLNHPTITLREFGLIGELDGKEVLINYVTHPAIVKDPTSTLTRTVWLVF